MKNAFSICQVSYYFIMMEGENKLISTLEEARFSNLGSSAPSLTTNERLVFQGFCGLGVDDH